ncbi:MAG: 2OG-Fe(II) oxygenase [Leptospira sp.]|nr:2OG-Fe(II) oxygenase [Leptospira sp.]
MSEMLSKLIVDKLLKNKIQIKKNFELSINKIGVRYCYIDELLPNEIVDKISIAFPRYESMRHLKSFKEDKFTSKSFDNFDPILKDITFAIQNEEVIKIISEITGIPNQIADPTLYAGGLSIMVKNSFLNPHIDNSHDGDRTMYRTLNLLYYVSKEWKLENGGNLELWNKTVNKHITIESKFNRLVLMETNPWSWHSVNKVRVEKVRNCISNYYFSKSSPLDYNYFHVTSFSARPEEKIKAFQYFLDNNIRKLIRYVFPKGLGKKDIYNSKNQN